MARSGSPPVRWIGLLIGLGGVALLAGPHLVGAAARGSIVGEVLFVALCYATGPLIANSKLGDVPGRSRMTAVCLVVAALVYAPLAALTWPSPVPSVACWLDGRAGRRSARRWRSCCSSS